ncbi:MULTISPECIES: nucleotidyltransferase family protein [unclassified Streptomyces]|uniref:nucleotidyltransferase family protein n=1 Tax=unclassified Streptomyces TaxID=2593676 RepID=UPI0036F04156
MAAIEALGAAESSRILDLLRARVLATRRLAPFASGNAEVRACLDELSPRVEKLRHMHAVLDANLERLDLIARKAGIELFAGKGVGARDMYDDPSVRDFNDIDIFVRSRADATQLSQALRNDHGYRYQHEELPWFKLDPVDGLLYGQIALVAPDEAPEYLNVDIHFGDYSVRHCSRLSITGTFPSEGPGLHRMAPEENLACIVNNAAGDYLVTAKDTNDLLAAVGMPGFDVARFAAQIRQAKLEPFLRSTTGTLHASSVPTAEEERALDALPGARAWEPAPKPDGSDWRRRCVGTTLHRAA